MHAHAHTHALAIRILAYQPLLCAPHSHLLSIYNAAALDLVSTEERVKTLSLFSFCEGASLLDEAMKYQTYARGTYARTHVRKRAHAHAHERTQMHAYTNRVLIH